jgi:predicted metal-dependent HD superfamily phosphohydrolase
MNSEYKPYTNRLRIVDRYIRELFIDELPASIRYHDSDHTLHPIKGVVATAYKLGVMENISKIDLELLITAAYFHDTGFIRDYIKNEPIAARMAGRILKLIGYGRGEIEKIQSMILSTDLEVEPKTQLERILCDADLDNLGRDDFFELDAKLREGQRLKGMDVEDDLAWYKRSLDFLKNHRYFTETQRKLREEGKKTNIEKLLKLLKRIENEKVSSGG